VSGKRLDYSVRPGGALGGEIAVPGDKSVSHRALMLGSIAGGETRVANFLASSDCLATLRAMRAMGVNIERPEPSRLIIQGAGLDGLQPPPEALDLGNSGTSLRLLAGLLAGQRFHSRLTGDESLRRRPMARITEPLTQMGARIGTRPGGLAPLDVYGGRELAGIDYDLPVASAQVKSCLLLAGLYARGPTRIREPAPTRDHTERMLAALGARVKGRDGVITLDEGSRLSAADLYVPGDLSSAAFFLVGASTVPGSEVRIKAIGINPTRTGVIHILRRMGAEIELSGEHEQGGEPVADVDVRARALRGIDIPRELVPLAIDEFPAIFIAAACAEGETRLRGARELRVKESDRIQVMAEGLNALGVEASPTEDGIVIRGGELVGGCVDAHGDHRVAMAFAVAGLRASAPVEIRNCANVETSFPGFADLAVGAGLPLRWQWKEATNDG
jgi:3-phosphoshikimate 1-carboxyvinyltransferase